MTEYRVECLSWALSVPSFILNGNDLLPHRSKLDPQDAILQLVSIFMRLDRQWKVYTSVESTERYFQIMENTAIIGHILWRESSAGNDHVSASKKDDDVVLFHIGYFEVDDHGVACGIEIVQWLPVRQF